jgi:hypothetical protein
MSGVVQKQVLFNRILQGVENRLRVLTLFEHVLRKNLHTSGESMSGLYAGNPKRQTSKPTTERLLKAF